MNFKNWINTQVALLTGKYFSLDRTFKNNSAIAQLHFVEGKNINVKIIMNGITYFFEGEPEIKKYNNTEGKEVIQQTWKYGGWEADINSEEVKLL